MANNKNSGETESFSSRTRRAFRQKGARYVLQAGIRMIRGSKTVTFLHDYFNYLSCKERWVRRTFVFNGQKLKYFCRWYNITTQNERAIEIPIVQSILRGNSGKILEIGNVLSHYFPVKHDIVDKYEVAKGVRNADAVDFDTAERYAVIVCISTLEHIGWDETPRSSPEEGRQKILCTIANLKRLLAAKGKIVVTAPIGYNPNLNFLLKRKEIDFKDMFFLKRISKDNEWQQTNAEDAMESKFGDPYPFANGLLVGIIES
jgi:hypothetical protein